MAASATELVFNKNTMLSRLNDHGQEAFRILSVGGWVTCVVADTELVSRSGITHLLAIYMKYQERKNNNKVKGLCFAETTSVCHVQFLKNA